MRKRALEMTSNPWEFQVKKVDPDFVPIISADAIWKKAKDAANENYKRGKELKEVLVYYKAGIRDLKDRYGVRTKSFGWICFNLGLGRWECLFVLGNVHLLMVKE